MEERAIVIYGGFYVGIYEAWNVDSKDVAYSAGTHTIGGFRTVLYLK